MNDTHRNRSFCQGSLLALALLLGVPFFAGCGSSQPETATAVVTVVVTYDGKPVTKGSVNMIVMGSAQLANGELNDAGTVTIQDVEVGNYTVAILPPDPPFPEPGKPAPPVRVYANIPQTFRSETTSPLTAEVKEGSNEFTFDLKNGQ